MKRKGKKLINTSVPFVIAYADGSYNYEFGAAGVGIKILTPEGILFYDSLSILGPKSPEETEYHALYEATFTVCKHYGEKTINYGLVLYTDSEDIRKTINEFSSAYHAIKGEKDIYNLFRKFKFWNLYPANDKRNNNVREVDALAKMAMYDLKRSLMQR